VVTLEADVVQEPVHEFIKSNKGRILGEIIQQGETFQVWKKERPRFPPRHRRSLLGSCASLDDARRLASKLRR
jgi:hypothetical protein